MNSFTYVSQTRAAEAAPGRFSARPDGWGISSQVGPLDEATRVKRENGISRRVHGIVASQKNARSMRWSTTEQRDMMALLEVDPAIISYETAPELVRFALGDRSWEHVPAFRAITRRGPVVLDTFPTRGWSNPNRQRLIAALTEVYSDRNVRYRACCGNQIRLEPRFGNARWIKARCSYRPSQDEVLCILHALTVADCRSIAELEAGLPQMQNVAAVVSHMAVTRQLMMDLSSEQPEAIVVSLGMRADLR